MDTKTLFLLLALGQLGNAPMASAETNIYKHVDKDGNITFTNRAIDNAQKISIASFSRNQLDQSKSQANPFRAKNTTQSERMALRRQILEEELMTEKRLFNDTQNFLNQASNQHDINQSQGKVVQLRNKLFLHQRNIAALKKELER